MFNAVNDETYVELTRSILVTEFERLAILYGAQNYTEIEPILAGLDRWYEMRFWIPNPGEPVSIQWLRSQGLI